MTAAVVRTTTIAAEVGGPLVAEHYLYSRARHDARVAEAERAVARAHARLRLVRQQRATERARAERITVEYL